MSRPSRCSLLAAVLASSATLATLAACSSGPSAPASQPASAADTATTTTAAGPSTTAEPTTTTAPAPGLPDELRAAWVHLFDDTLKTRAGIRALVDTAEAADLNALFVQVIRRYDAYYASDVLPRTPDPALEPGLDVLAAVIEEAQPRGIQVHAWMAMAPAYHHAYDDLSLPPDHVYVVHGPSSADSWMTVDAGGAVHETYFDLGLPAVQDHIAAVVDEIASDYEVDGFHTDYVRYDGRQYGYHPGVLGLYQAETGAGGVPAPDDAAWAEWRRGRITALAERVASVARSARPGITVSAAVIAQQGGPASTGGFEGTVAYAQKLQDWPAWLEGGTVDLALPMAYFREADPQQRGWFREWVAFATELAGKYGDRKVAVGLGGWLNSVDASLVQARAALAGTDGVSVFSYQQDSSDAPHGAFLRALGTVTER